MALGNETLFVLSICYSTDTAAPAESEIKMLNPSSPTSELATLVGRQPVAPGMCIECISAAGGLLALGDSTNCSGGGLVNL